MIVLLGPSGCGKTTLLRSIAGLELPQEGLISIKGREVYSSGKNIYIPPESRDVSMVFQSYALWPHMTVRENIAFPLKSRKVSEDGQRKKVEEICEVINLGHLIERYPNQLSGGQQQRVALGRAIAAGSDVVLFDEPLSNVDAKVREQIRREISSLQRRFGFSGVYVTHDQVEASAIADKLVVMDHGTIVQIGSPKHVYQNPTSIYVATFMGSANQVPATMAATGAVGDQAKADAAIGPCVGEVRGKPIGAGDGISVVFRPEVCSFSKTQVAGTLNCWKGKIVDHMFLGPLVETFLELESNVGPVAVSIMAPEAPGEVGQEGWLTVPPEKVWLFKQ